LALNGPARRGFLPRRIVSGGQAGVDRAALDVALALGFEVGGWCPAGRKAVDGPIDPRYPLTETPSPGYRQRTGWNVRDSDATLILTLGALRGGSALTRSLALQQGKPCLVVDLKDEGGLAVARAWLAQIGPESLNVAGPRESGENPVGENAREWLEGLLGR